jgi:SNF2 family DNA or RNA helicase
MITAVQNQDVYIIRFPYDAEIIKLIKNVPGRQYVPDNKYWTIPLDRLGFLIAQLQGTPYESQIKVYSAEHINENATLDATSTIPDIDISKIPLYVKDGEHLFQHQLDFMKYAIDRQRRGLYSGFILADEQGLGKTLEVMNLALYNRKFNKIKHCLIIACVNSAKYNWIYDIEKHTNGQEVPYLLGSRKKKDGTIVMESGSYEKLEDLKCGHMYGKKDEPPLPFFLIMNIEALRMLKDRHYPIRERLTTLCNKGYIGMIALDEIHHGVSPTSKQGKQLLKLKKDITAKVEWIPMTGTPIVNKAVDVFLPLKLVDGHTYKSYYSWCENFCVYGGFGGYQVIAYKNTPQLKQMLQANMLRRLKSQVLDLPPKIRIVEYVENTPYQARLYAKIALSMLSHKDEILSMVNPMVRFLKLRQVNGSPELIDNTLTINSSYLSKNSKMARLLDLVSAIISNGEKVVIFSNWVESLRTVYRFLAKDYKVCCYTGTMKSEEREMHKQRFITDPEYQIMIGTIGALGTSHTLTVANNVIFYDLPWNQATVEQAEDRCHRTGTTQTVNVHYIITKNSVDERVYNIIMSKDGISKYIVDNELSIKDNPQLFEYLLGYDKNSKKEKPCL